MKNFFVQSYILFIALTMGLVSCSDHDEIKEEKIIQPGIYSTEITLYTEKGEAPNINTRGLDANNGEFTSEYPYDYIYIHSADNNPTPPHRSLRIPLKTVEQCDDCKGIHLEVEVLEENGKYIIRNEEGDEITLNSDESVYFSTIPDAFWKAQVEGATPVSQSDIFVESEANKELLKSKLTYTKSELISLIEKEIPYIEMSRHCTGFRVYFLFTRVTDGNQNTVDKELWDLYLSGTKPEDFYIKLYLGPNFCHTFDILNNTALNGDKGGYYTTNDQTYAPFTPVNYAYTGGSSSETYVYTGFGYQTADNHYLLSPLNSENNIAPTEFSIYAFIKYNNGNINVESDEGSKYFRAIIKDITLTLNRIHYIIMAFDLRDLKVFTNGGTSTNNVLTRSPWEEPEEIELKPVKVICR